MIKLSSKWNYAVKAIVFLINNNNLVNISEISKKEWISESLLRRIIADLEKSWIVNTIKWRNWWIKITQDLSKISLYDVLSSVWEDLWIRDCSWWLWCLNNDNCSTYSLYLELQKWFNWILKLYTLDKIKKFQI